MLIVESLIALCLAGFVLAVDNKIDVESAYNEYCEICHDHTLCKFQGLGKACEDSNDGGVTAEEKENILHRHNEYRRNVAKGTETRGLKNSQPHAGNMMKMEWDEELAKIAQHWADQCQFQHDTCRHDKRFKVGQNIYWNWRVPILRTVNWTAAIASWYDEVDKFDHESVQSYEFNNETGHYTQLVWHDSSLIGCGRRSYGPNKIYVCNYGPTGNWLNEPMYSRGEPCSSCPGNTHCQDGLCAPTVDQESVSNDNSGGDLELLNPPTVDAVSVYNDTEKIELAMETTQEPLTTRAVLPALLNLVESANLWEDEDLLNDIIELKKRLDRMQQKIEFKRKHKDDHITPE